jgi:thiol:disulfide interchange protein
LTGRVGILVALLALVAVVTAACIPLGGGGSSAGTGQVEWLYDWQEATSKAEAENKPLMVNFYTDVCPECDKMDRITFSDGEVAAFLNENFVNVKINPDKPETQYLGREYGIWGVPTNVFATPDGLAFGKKVGRLSPSRYSDWARTMLARWDKFNE